MSLYDLIASPYWLVALRTMALALGCNIRAKK
jgi:hypothetical protein